MEFRVWLESTYLAIWYHATDTPSADQIMKNGWSVAVPRKTDVGDLGWGIYFYKFPLKGTYGNIVIEAQVDMQNVIDIKNEDHPAVKLWMKMFFYTPKSDILGSPKTRTIDPYADERIERGNFREKAIEMLKKQGHDFGSAMDKVSSYMKPMDDSTREINAKVIRRQMLKIGVKGVVSGKELAVFDPNIIKSQKVV